MASVERRINGVTITVCPTSSARKLRVRPIPLPNCKSAAPSTICGSTSGESSNDEMNALPGNEYRAIASAAGTTSAIAIMVAHAASSVLVTNDDT